MIKMRNVAFAAAVAAGVAGFAAPASAAYVRLGSVEVGFKVDRDTNWTRFGGRMEGLRLKADRSDIQCRSIRVLYGNGKWGKVFSGRLREDQPVKVDLQGGLRIVKRIDFVCRSLERGGAKINIMADVGRYRDDWKKSPEWNNVWAKLFNLGAAGPAPQRNSWVRIGRKRFSDYEMITGQWKGHRVARVGLRPVDGNASCTRVRANFANGTSVALDPGKFDRMQRGRLYQADLPGKDRTIVKLGLVCHALGDAAVTIEVLAWE